jgi:hypothetical protein
MDAVQLTTSETHSGLNKNRTVHMNKNSCRNSKSGMNTSRDEFSGNFEHCSTNVRTNGIVNTWICKSIHHGWHILLKRHNIIHRTGKLLIR